MGRRHGAAIAILALAAGLSGCGSAPWAAPGQTAAPTPTAERTFGQGTTAAEPAATPSAAPVASDLAAGSLARTLTAGAVQIDVTYWSDLAMDEWTAGSPKPLSLSLTASIDPDDGQGVYLQRASVAVQTATGESGATAEDTATESPGYLIGAPYSYSQAFALGAVPEGTASITVSLRYELLVQTTPTSDEYAKQTATDTLTIALAG
ncbi:hypothetical protein [Microbacterium excoecariae]|uniref:hypothetical protein n=1 Tax=Microbacterium excoecariae TaxID=2715210 RepID=UPI0014087136|nr:hypothetical protein [Microbacterium excoecariae]NHI17600.1 hypothetical protein [Microbacterium excoecariae]